MSAEPTVSSRGLTLLDRANRLLSEANSLEDLKEVRDTAEAARTFAKAARLGLELQNRAAELKLRAERKAGSFLANLRLRGGDRRSKSQPVTLKLDQLGVTKRQSLLWQLAASVPESQFEQYLRSKNVLGQELTASGLLRIAKALRTRPAPSSGRAKAPPTVGVEGIHAGKAELLSMVRELKEQCRHLAELLKPLADGDERLYKPAERKFIGRLSQDVEKSLYEIEQLLWKS